MNEQNTATAAEIYHLPNGYSAWSEYWKAQGIPWRTEPEIEAGRRQYLTSLRTIVPDIEKGIYPFKAVQLTRADVEWLLATHESGKESGPVDWSKESERTRKGLDLRGCSLREANLNRLPLAGTRFGLEYEDWRRATVQQRENAAAMLEQASLRETHLEGSALNSTRVAAREGRANLGSAFLNQAFLADAHLEGVNLSLAHLNGAFLVGAHLAQAALIQADLEGANLFQADLRRASLVKANLDGCSLGEARLAGATLTQSSLKGTGLFQANLQGANLVQANLESAALLQANLQEANLVQANLDRADLFQARLEKARLDEVILTGANLREAHLEGAILRHARLEEALLRDAHLEGADLFQAHADRASMRTAHLEHAQLQEARFVGADLDEAHLEGASLVAAHLEGASLRAAHLEGAVVSKENFIRIRKWCPQFPPFLAPADMRGAFFDSATSLEESILGTKARGYIQVADIRWGGVDLAVVKWVRQDQRRWRRSRSIVLGDESVARKWTRVPRTMRLTEFEKAVRANRQLASALRTQGLHEDADHFAYRAQICQRKLLWHQGRPVQWLISWFFALLAGYGYRPALTFFWYLLLILGFAVAYKSLGPSEGHSFSWQGAFVFSVTSFHGRGFFPGGLELEDLITQLAALEAVAGLLIEISFIATFTQRFFGK